MADEQDSVDNADSGDSADALAALEMISAALAEVGNDEAPVELDENSFEFSLTEAMRLLPRRYIKDPNAKVFEGESIVVTIPDLFEQLARGKVTIPVAKLAYFVPVNLMNDAAFQDTSTVDLSLKSVVQSVGMEAFASRIPTRIREYDIEDLPDPFKEPEGTTISLGSEEVSAEMEQETVWGADPDEGEVADEPAEATAKETSEEPAAVESAEEVTVGPKSSEEVSTSEEAADEPPDEAAASVEETSEAVEIPAIPPALPEVPPIVDSIGTVKMPWPKSDDSGAELSYIEFPGNINMNVATSDEMQALPAVDETLAQAIVAYRDANGAFESIFELNDIDGVDPAMFLRITGMPVNEKRYHRRNRLAGLLRVSADKLADLDLIVERLLDKPGYSGCVISDAADVVLAQKGIDKISDDLCAIVPRTVSRIREDMELAGAGQVGTVSMSIEGELYTVIATGRATLIVVHAEDQVSGTDLSFIRKVGKELAWLLSLRAYVGPKT